MMKQKANEADQESDLREAFKIFDRDKDGFIDLKELKTVATMLGSMLTKEEVEEFMREADVVRHNTNADVDIFTPDNNVVIHYTWSHSNWRSVISLGWADAKMESPSCDVYFKCASENRLGAVNIVK